MSAEYKETLLLPKTDFPMRAELGKREPERLAQWERDGLYARVLRAREGAPLFVLHDGPPFANGDVHMGTALNKILKDLIVKSRSMLGFRAPFVPGWDCHGLPIEFKVVKAASGLDPAEVRRRAEAFAREYIDVQRCQFKRLGVLGDWERPYLTLEPAYEAEILRAFGAFVKKGLVYRQKKPVYWSTGAQTALAEAEVEYAQREDPAITVKFDALTGPTAEMGAAFAIWTTTPWTLPANVAIAVNPREEYTIGRFEKAGATERLVVAVALVEAFAADTGWALAEEMVRVRGEALVGGAASHPFLERESRVIGADFVAMDTGTGQVHIAPGHGKDDYVAGMANGLPVLSPVDDAGRLTEECGVAEWTGRYVFDANAEIVKALGASGHLLSQKPYTHEYPHCWRSKTPIVFRAVEQFFIRVDALRAGALAAVEAAEWVPHWGKNRIAGTVEARPDWCISRQRTWGVPLPVFYAPDGEPVLDEGVVDKVAALVEKGGTNLWFEKDDAWWAEAVGLAPGHTRRNDTLDVWIDSGVSHRAVLRKHPDLRFPADVYIEATDQHRGWFQSSLMTSVALEGCAPYRTVITHGFVVDKDSKRKLSKSQQGGYHKPTEAAFYVDKYGADIVRLWAASTAYTEDVPFSEENFTRVSETYRGFRNVVRILLANLHDYPAELRATAGAVPAGATRVDRWVLGQLQRVVAECRKAYEAYEFRAAFDVLNGFCTNDLSALYVDITKDRMYCDAADSPRRRATQAVMFACFNALSRLLAPVLAFTADEAWESAGLSGSVHEAVFPEPVPTIEDAALAAEMEGWLKIRAAVYAKGIEPARQAKTLAKSLEASVKLGLPADLFGGCEAALAELEEFLIVGSVSLYRAAEIEVAVERSGNAGCPRCWRHVSDIGERGLCTRCAGVV